MEKTGRMDSIATYIKIGLGIAAICGVLKGSYYLQDKLETEWQQKHGHDDPSLVVSSHPNVRTYMIDGKFPVIIKEGLVDHVDFRKGFVDEAPFGSRDYVEDYTMERKPFPSENLTFSQLEKQAKEDGMIR